MRENTSDLSLINAIHNDSNKVEKRPVVITKDNLMVIN